jgi:hypothetical protein
MRVLKPGGHLVAFGGTRTYHRLACAIEDAGFEIRDMLAWLYGSGFPKSLDVSKAIDKAAGTGREVVGSKVGLPGYSLKDNDTDGHGRQTYSRFTNADAECAITAPATDAARRWEGWGTALKPAHEPICLARKPLSEGTVAANVLRWGTGALNIDACRTETNPNVDDPRLGGKGSWGTTKMAKNVYKGGYAGVRVGSSALGRWPANLAHDGSDEVVAMFPDAAGGGNIKQGRDPGYGGGWQTQAKPSMGDSGSAARFFASFPMEDECPSIKYANDVEEALSLRSERVVSALSHAVGQSTRRLALQSTSYRAQNTSVSVNELNLVCASVIEAIQNIERRRLLGLPPESATVTLGPVMCAAIQNPTGIMTITLSLSMCGRFADLATFDIIGTNAEVGDGACARFHYSSKASGDERLGSKHPTVKPVAMMQWLVRMVTPGGIVLDPFAGSGTTGEAAILEGFGAILIEREADSVADIERRLAHVMASVRERRETIVKANGRVTSAGPLFDP